MNPRGVVANVQDCNIVESKFKFQLSYHVHFWTDTFGKGMNPFNNNMQLLWLLIFTNDL